MPTIGRVPFALVSFAICSLTRKPSLGGTLTRLQTFKIRDRTLRRSAFGRRGDVRC
jgi:hypothetical protein